MQSALLAGWRLFWYKWLMVNLFVGGDIFIVVLRDCVKTLVQLQSTEGRKLPSVTAALSFVIIPNVASL